MKTLSIYFLSTFFCSVFAQENCNKKSLDILEKAVIRDYFKEATKNRFFHNDIGIIVVKEDNSNFPEKQWHIDTYIENTFRLDSTFSYAYFSSDLILFKTLSNDKYPVFQQVEGCWKEIIGDRLFVRSPRVKRMYKITEDGWEDGKPILDSNKKEKIVESARRSYLDGSVSNRIYVFSKEKGIISKRSIP